MEPTVIACSCNGTVDVAGARLDDAGSSAPWRAAPAASELCRRGLPRFTEALARGEPLLVTCTQEAALFEEVARARSTVAPVRFVNVRERAGWGAERAAAGPKIAALVAIAAASRVEPVPAVGYSSRGRVLVIGAPADALDWGGRLAGSLPVTVLLTGRDGTALPPHRAFAVVAGRLTSLGGWLGRFEARWEVANPIDLEACVRCGACVAACPEHAIGDDFLVDADRCGSHRRCVAACADVGAIDFSRADASREGGFDLVLDLGATPAISRHDPPLGYFRPGRDERARARAALELVQLVGEFEKPRYFRYDEKTCAHARNGVEGCRACHDACGASAISLEADRIRVEPHLCLGCGTCSTVCPTGAIAHQFPAATELVRRIRVGLRAYRERGGRDAVVLLHDSEAGSRMLDEVGRGPLLAPGPARAAPGVRGLPARVIPVEVHKVGAAGIDVALAALAVGAAQVLALCTPADSDGDREALETQYRYACDVVAALGMGTGRVQVVAARDAADLEARLHALEPRAAVAEAATFDGTAEKRRTIDAAVEHLLAQAVASGANPPDAAPLAAGAPFGSIDVARERCTLCMACVGACPAGALRDTADSPSLRFVERNCVQCGLCVKTCPEKAVALVPRYAFGPQARAAREVARARPFECVRCGKAFGSDAMVKAMTARLAGHPSLGTRGARRLLMCGDCRVADLLESPADATVDGIGPGAAE